MPADLDRRRQAYKLWADASFGMLGRTGDYLNSALMALASAADWFGQADTAFARNIVAYYEKVRENDLLCTHTLMAHIVREDDNGIVVRGARMLATIGPFADELLVFPSTVLRGTPRTSRTRSRSRFRPTRRACGSSPASPLIVAARTSTTRWGRGSTSPTR